MVAVVVVVVVLVVLVVGEEEQEEVKVLESEGEYDTQEGKFIELCAG